MDFSHVFPLADVAFNPLGDLLTLAVAAAGLLLALIAAVVVLRVVFGRQPAAEDASDNRTIDVAQLPAQGPPASGPRLEFQHLPVRLAVLVVAPVGKNGILPAAEKLREALEGITPNLMAVVDAHQPIFRRWPRQLSSQGFVQSFFNNVSLPGERGKGTPWCAVAGRIEARPHPLLVGMVCCAAAENSHAQVTIENPAEWPKVIAAFG